MASSVPLAKKFFAELIGTFWLVLGGCGSAVLAAVFPYDNPTANPLGLGFLGVSLAFGLTLLTMVYTFGHISGCHINPAVSFGLWAGGKFPGSQLLPYVIAQVLGGVIAGGVILLVASGREGFALTGGNPLATNGWGAHSPGGYGFLAALVIEVILTFVFLLVIMGATDRLAPGGFAGVPIGLSLTLIHLISIPRHKHICESCPQHRRGGLGRRRGDGTAVVVLGGADRRRPAGGLGAPHPDGLRHGQLRSAERATS